MWTGLIAGVQRWTFEAFRPIFGIWIRHAPRNQCYFDTVRSVRHRPPRIFSGCAVVVCRT